LVPRWKYCLDANGDHVRTSGVRYQHLKLPCTGCVWIIGGFCKTIFSQILNTNTRCYYHLKEECLQFHSDLKCIWCAPHVWHGRCTGDTLIPAKLPQA
jgi:hypothetical protein